MPASKQLIKKITIHRFRSFSDAEIEADLLNIYSGKNNAGKSNILKALNLFFNNKTNYDTPYDSSRDYNSAFRGAAGGKREIRITVEFMPSGNGALKYGFSVTKRFSEGSDAPTIEYSSPNEIVQNEINKKNGNITRQFTAYLNRLEYIYIPAIRDKAFISSLLLKFEQIINNEAQSKEFTKSIKSLSEVLSNTSKGVSRDFEKYIGINATAALSSKATDVLGATVVNVFPGIQIREKKGREKTDKKQARNVAINLFSSGDGIVMSYLIYFLAYLTKQNNKKYIWGYEEPENSLEYSNAQKLAIEFSKKFTKNAQIFLTTHSPAFINLMNDDNVKFYRVFQRPLSQKEIEAGIIEKRPTYVCSIDTLRKQLGNLEINDPSYEALNRELHLAEQAIEIETKLNELENEKIEAEKLIKKYESVITDQNKLVLLSEGDNIDHIKLAIKTLDKSLLKSIKFIDNAKDRTGKNQLKSIYDHLKMLKLNSKIMIIFDCDVEAEYGKLESTDKLFVYIMPNNSDNKKTRGGIENIYPEQYIDEDDFIKKETSTNSGKKIDISIDKAKFLKKITNISETDKEVFKNYKPLIEEIHKHIA